MQAGNLFALSLLVMAAIACCSILFGADPAYADSSCHVSVHISQSPSRAEINGTEFARENPDGTFYPGDAFEFTILVSWTQNCWHIYPRAIQSAGLTLGTVHKGQVSYDGDGNAHYYEYGHAEIGTGSSGARLSQEVDAFGLVCGIDRCTKGYTYGEGSYAPPIIRPQVTVALKFENLTDRDGYKMRNGDGTYYVWDGIDIVYDPDYKWKAERLGTIDARTDYASDLALVGRYECRQVSCPHTFSESAIVPWAYAFGYEEGFTAFNSTGVGMEGAHAFQYHATVYNMGRKIGDGYNQTRAMVVRYAPVFASYPYVVLKDGSSWWGFGKAPAVALHYYGSLGGGNGGQAVVHGDRRSKVNGFRYSSFAYKVLEPVPLNESMAWAGSYPARFSEGNLTYRDDALQPGNGSAMFVRAGYGKIVFRDPILHTILRTRLDNSTIINTLQSSGFAGYGTYNLTRYQFGYPQTRFSTDVKVLALHSDGSVSHMPLDVSMVPDFAENATYEQDFVRTKVAHDSDRIIAGIVLDDMYGTQDNASGSGVINMRANLTSMAIPGVYRALAQDPLDLPLSLVYEQPSPYNVTITAGARRISFIERAFEFDTNWTYVVNTDPDNRLNATRYGGVVTIYADPGFGPYAKIFVNGAAENTPCTYGCTVLLHDRNSNATLTALNVWGGSASVTLGALGLQAAPFDPAGAAEDVLLLAVSAIGYGLARRHWKAVSSALGFGGEAGSL